MKIACCNFVFRDFLCIIKSIKTCCKNIRFTGICFSFLFRNKIDCKIRDIDFISVAVVGGGSQLDFWKGFFSFRKRSPLKISNRNQFVRIAFFPVFDFQNVIGFSLGKN